MFRIVNAQHAFICHLGVEIRIVRPIPAIAIGLAYRLGEQYGTIRRVGVAEFPGQMTDNVQQLDKRSARAGRRKGHDLPVVELAANGFSLDGHGNLGEVFTGNQTIMSRHVVADHLCDS